MPDQKRYTIKLLEWRQFGPYLTRSVTSVGKYLIWKYNGGEVTLEYSFRGFGGPKAEDSYFHCGSVDEAKNKAWEHYLKLILPCLQEIQE